MKTYQFYLNSSNYFLDKLVKNEVNIGEKDYYIFSSILFSWICLESYVNSVSEVLLSGKRLSETEKAFLDVQIYDWAENIDDSSEMFFDYWIYNFGDVEAKNIRVRCDLIEDDLETRRTSVVHTLGNLASRSESFEEVTTNNPPIIQGEEFIGLCYVESCDNCEILYKRIPELIESYEG